MNKADLNSLKKMINPDNEFLTINNVLTAVINKDTIKYKETRPWISYTSSEQEDILQIIRKTLTGKLGKIVTEYAFPVSEKGCEEQDMLINVMTSRFEEEDINEIFLNNIKNSVSFDCTYTVFSVNFTISFYDKITDMSQEMTFIAVAFCPVTLRFDGFVYNDTENTVKKRTEIDRVLEKATDGFLFPTMSEHNQDVNHVMYYNKNSNKPNISIIENFLGCKYLMNAEKQKITFWGMAAKILGNDLTFDMIIKINEQLTTLVLSSEGLPEAREIDCADMQHIFEKCGIDSKKLDELGDLYEKVLGSRHTMMTVSNLCEEKVDIRTGDTNIHMNFRSATRNLNVKNIDGKNCLVIPVDTTDISVMGIETRI